jgi:hypothetical protein
MQKRKLGKTGLEVPAIGFGYMGLDKLTPADPRDLADAIAFALRYSGGKRVRDADEVVATIAARRMVEHLRAARYHVMKRLLWPSAPPGANSGRPYRPSSPKT